MAILTVPAEGELRAFVRAYDLGDLVSWDGLEAGTVNTSYRLQIGEQSWFLRIYEEQGPDGAARDAELQAYLSSAGVPTPPPAVGRDGRRTRILADKPAALFPWVSGGIVCTRAVTPAHGEAVGRALAGIHRVGLPPGLDLGAGRFGPDEILARCDRVARSTDAEARARAEPLREAVRAVAAQRTTVATGLVHGDLFRDNVLWHEGSIAVAALLDFESAHEGPFVFDLAVTILSWSFRDDFELPVARAIVRGYLSERDLGEDERAAFFDEARFACLRFTVTRITDDAARIGKRWQRFVARQASLEKMGRAGTREAFGL